MKPIQVHILMLVASVLTMLMGAFQIKRKDTDFMLMGFGTMEITLGAILLIVTLGTWNCF